MIPGDLHGGACGGADFGEKKKPTEKLAFKILVARTRFELVISALRGRRPKPLDERAIYQVHHLAGVEGVEPSLTEPESAVLPLDDTPVLSQVSNPRVTRVGILRKTSI